MTAPPVSLAASPDGAWIARKAGARLSLHPAARLADAATVELDTDDFDLTFAGPPDQLVAVVRGPIATQVLLYNPPDLEIAARGELDGRAELQGVSGPRLALIAGEHRKLALVRCAPRALVVQPTDSEPMIENVVGLEDNKLLVCWAKKLEQWDAVLRRAMLRLNLPLPPAPRLLGAAKGAFWSAHVGGDSVYAYRASDGRAFEHRIGGAVVSVASHLHSPTLVVATAHDLVRIHIFAHTTVSMGNRGAAALAQAVTPAGEATIYGCDDGDALWRASLAEGASIEREQIATRPRGIVLDAIGAKPPVSRVTKPARTTGEAARGWRADLVGWTEGALARETKSGFAPQPIDDPAIPFDAALSVLGDRIAPTARRALALCYGAWLRGAPRTAVATVASVLGGGDEAWAEALGAGTLGAHGWVTVEAGAIGLHPVVARHLDGAPPQAVALRGEPPAREPPRGVVIARMPIDTVGDVLGAIAILRAGASLDDGALEARLADAVLVVPLGAAPARAIAALAERGGDAIVIAPASAPLPARLAPLPAWPPAPPPE